MKQKVCGGFPSTRNNNSHEALSPSNLAPAAFNTNQNGTLCLPLISENQKIIWVHSDQINIPLDKAAELDKVFSRFPYLTQRQTISLAQHCCLHPDQVRVWFMAQRLCYGISWDAKDIHEVRGKMLGRSRLKRKQHTNVFERDIVKKPKQCREDIGKAEEGVDSNTLIIKRELPTNVAIVNNINTEKMQKTDNKTVRTTEQTSYTNVTKEIQMLWPIAMVPKPKGENSEALLGSCSKPVTTYLPKTNYENCLAIKDDFLDRSPSTFQTDVGALETPLPMENYEDQQAMNHLPSQMQQVTQEPQIGNVLDGSSIKQPIKLKKGHKDASMSDRIKTPKQLAIMKEEFAKYQYPNEMQYQELSLLTGVPRNSLVQWFNDMRYVIKKTKPRWLSVEQHSTALRNVLREQCLRKLKKMEKTGREARQSCCGETL